MANRGFVTLAVAYFGFEDLPKGLEEFRLDYFGSAVEFLQKQQRVKLTGIGVLGISKGADLALSMATFLPGIKAAVSISGCGVNTFSPLHCDGFTVSGLGFSPERILITADNVINFLEALDDPTDPAHTDCHIPVENSPAAFLFLSGLDDQNSKSAFYCQEPIARLRRHGRQVEVHNYPGAGHLLEPPYSPVCQVTLSGIGVLGISKGADLALSIATFLPGIKAAVSICGCGANSFSTLHCDGFAVPSLGFSLEKMTISEEKVANFLEVLHDPTDPANKDSRIPVKKSPAAFLFLSGLDDQNWKSVYYCQEPIARLKAHGREVEVHNYPGAGHLLEPPYLPLCQASFHKVLGMPVLWGGQWKEHALAQEDAWSRIHNFLFKHLLD